MTTGDRPEPRATIPLSEALVGGLVLAVALVAWASLALAHAGRHSGWLALLLGPVATGATVVLALRYGGARVRVVTDRSGLASIALVAAVAAFLSFPAFGYGVTDKDPGGYVAHAAAIAREGSYDLHDEVLDRLPGVELKTGGVRFPAVWIRNPDTGLIVPQFYHLWPALLATADDVGGLGGMLAVTPLLAMLAAAVLTVLLRRVANGVAGLLGGLLLATNLMQVWQAKYPTTEIISQLFYLGALLGVVVALKERWRPAAGFAGLLVGVAYLARPDALLLLLVSTAAGAALVVFRRWDGRARWYAGGLGIVLPHGFYQAYSTARTYTFANSVPPLRKLLVLVTAAFALAVLLRWVARPVAELVVRVLADRRAQFWIGFAICAVAALLMVAGFLRPRLFGEEYYTAGGRTYRSYDEQILRRLSWFLTLPAFALMGLGLAVVALRRWRSEVWAVVLPTLLILPLYGYTSKVASRLMWWNRRYVPTVLPGIVILVAIALGFALTYAAARRNPAKWRALLGVPAALLSLFLLASYTDRSLGLRGHDEFGGSLRIGREISALAGNGKGIFLWQPCDGCTPEPTHLFGAALWLTYGEYSALLPREPRLWPGYVKAFRDRFPGLPVFVVLRGEERPEGLESLRLERARTFREALPVWQESDITLPSEPIRLGLEFTVWRVAGT